MLRLLNRLLGRGSPPPTFSMTTLDGAAAVVLNELRESTRSQMVAAGIAAQPNLLQRDALCGYVRGLTDIVATKRFSNEQGSENFFSSLAVDVGPWADPREAVQQCEQHLAFANPAFVLGAQAGAADANDYLRGLPMCRLTAILHPLA